MIPNVLFFLFLAAGLVYILCLPETRAEKQPPQLPTPGMNKAFISILRAIYDERLARQHFGPLQIMITSFKEQYADSYDVQDCHRILLQEYRKRVEQIMPEGVAVVTKDGELILNEA